MNGQFKPGDIVLNNWRLDRLIGEGCCGKVYAAACEDANGAAYVSAVKIITIPQSENELKNARAKGMDDQSIAAYFHGVVDKVIQEVRWMSNFAGSGGIVNCADHAVIAHQNGIGWDIIIRMELLTPLAYEAQGKKLSRNDVIRLGIDLCKVLELCQKHRIIHGDIKPENIFRSEQGNYKLGDFGIARTVEAAADGLPRKDACTYMAPEVYWRNPYNSSVDICSLGLVMYELLNENRAPFLPPFPAAITPSDRERALARRMSGEQLIPPKNADARLAEIVLRACAYHPQNRYSDPAQMGRELEALYDPNETVILERAPAMAVNLPGGTVPPNGPTVIPPAGAMPPTEPLMNPPRGNMPPAGPAVYPPSGAVPPAGPAVVPPAGAVPPSGPAVNPPRGNMPPAGPAAYPPSGAVPPAGPTAYPPSGAVPPAGPAVNPPRGNMPPAGPAANPPILKGALIIQARDSQTGKVLPGAEFRITTAAGYEVGPNGVIGVPANAQANIFTTDSQGEIRVGNMTPGPYVLTEVKTPEGYTADAPHINVAIGANGGVQTVVVTNTRMKKKGGKKKVFGILAVCAVLLIGAAAFCVLALPKMGIDLPFPFASPQPSASSDPEPTPSADPTPTLSADPEPTPSDDPEPSPSDPTDSPEPDVTETPWENPFTDVSEENWFYDAVRFAVEHGLINVSSNGLFNPHGLATRGMFVTLLYRLEDEPDVGDPVFDDVADGQYYAAAATWAAENGIVNGGGNHLFHPDDQIAREDLIVMLWRYAGKPEVGTVDLSGFPDADQINSWAETAMAWAVDIGIISSSDSRLNPRGDATRAEVVTYIMRLYEAM